MVGNQADRMNSYLSGISAANAVPNGGSYKGFGFPDQTYSSSLNMPFGITGAPTPAAQLTVPGINFNNVQRDNKFIGLPSFETVPTAYVMLVNRNDLASREDTRTLSIGQLAFARTSDNKILSRFGRQAPQYGVTPGQNSAEFKSLTALNAFLRGSGRTMYTHASQIVREWHMIGIFKNEVAPSSAWSIGQGRYASRTGNFIVSHRVKVLNYWVNSGGFLPGSKLHLIVKKVDDVFQIQPWGSIDSNFPSDSEIAGGETIFVGTVDDYFSAGEGGSARLHESLINQNMLGQIQIYVGV